MKTNAISTVLLGAALLAAMPSAHGQAAGFRVGIAAPGSPPPIGVMTAPIQPFVTPPITAFGVPPVAPVPQPGQPTSTFFAPPIPVPQRHLGNVHRNRGAQIAPGATIYAPGAVIVTPGYPAYSVIGDPYFVQPIVTSAIPPPQPIVGARPLPAVGTPRAQVLAEFGTPQVSVFTATQEMLQFNGGVKIILENGFVIR